MQNFQDRRRSQEAKFAQDQTDAFAKRASAVRALAKWADEIAPVAGAGDKIVEAGIVGKDADVIILTAELTARTEAEVSAKFAELKAG